jgi:RNA polymerase sigma factor (sigma-70 family)
VLIEEPGVIEILRQIVAGFTRRCPELQQDLMQESLVHLWKLERKRPGHTHSWYLQGCRFHLQHYFVSGRSLDSRKRSGADNRITIQEENDELALHERHTNGEVFEAVSFTDLVSTLEREIKPRERAVLAGLADGMSVREIAREFGISPPTIVKYRRRLAALALRLGVAEASSKVNHRAKRHAKSKIVAEKGVTRRKQPLWNGKARRRQKRQQNKSLKAGRLPRDVLR